VLLVPHHRSLQASPCGTDQDKDPYHRVLARTPAVPRQQNSRKHSIPDCYLVRGRGATNNNSNSSSSRAASGQEAASDREIDYGHGCKVVEAGGIVLSRLFLPVYRVVARATLVRAVKGVGVGDMDRALIVAVVAQQEEPRRIRPRRNRGQVEGMTLDMVGAAGTAAAADMAVEEELLDMGMILHPHQALLDDNHRVEWDYRVGLE
jgi:hypothetical protein